MCYAKLDFRQLCTSELLINEEGFLFRDSCSWLFAVLKCGVAETRVGTTPAAPDIAVVITADQSKPLET